MQKPFTRNELINVLRGWHKAFKRIGRSHERNVQALAEAADLMEYEWISVKDRLPNEPGEVLMVLYGRVCIAWYHAEGRFESGSGMVWDAGDAVTHWMPLPEPPKEEIE